MGWSIVGQFLVGMLKRPLTTLFGAAAVDEVAFDGFVRDSVFDTATEKITKKAKDVFSLDDLSMEQGLGIAAFVALTSMVTSNQSDSALWSMAKLVLTAAVAFMFKDTLGKAVKWAGNKISTISDRTAKEAPQLEY